MDTRTPSPGSEKVILSRSVLDRFHSRSHIGYVGLATLILVAVCLSQFTVHSIVLATRQNKDKWVMKATGTRIHPRRQTAKTDQPGIKTMAPKERRDAGISVARSSSTRGIEEVNVLNVEFKSVAAREAFRQPGATVITAVDRFADIFASSDDTIEAIQKRDDVVWLEYATTVEVPPPPTFQKAPGGRQVADAIVRGGISGLTGRGVIVAVVDTGIDFRNPDFISYDADGRPTSRLLYLWDTTSNDFDSQKLGTRAPFSYPNGASIGTLYTRDQLTAELRADSKRIPPTDLNGHGTACAGIAAGSGNNDKGPNGLNRRETVGVAPEADIIGIRFDQGDDNDGLENSYLLNAAVDWLNRVAGSRPLVASCSFGGHRGGHDGQLIVERELDARFPLSKPSRAIVVAAGNEGAENFHAEVDFSDKTNAKLVTWMAKTPSNLRIYFNSDDDQIGFAPAGDTRLAMVGGGINPFTKQLSATLKIPVGEGGVWLFTDSGKPTHAHLYLAGNAAFSQDVVSHSTLVGNPGTASNPITVASYDWNDSFDYQGARFALLDVCQGKELSIGALSCYSSPGYARNGRIKPEITSPGEWFVASYAKTLDGTGVGKWRVDTTGNYVAMNGTSSATPYTAGIIALMLEKKPTLTMGEIRQLLTTNSTRDRFTGDVPNPRWGYGKLDIVAVRKILAGL